MQERAAAAAAGRLRSSSERSSSSAFQLDVKEGPILIPFVFFTVSRGEIVREVV